MALSVGSLIAFLKADTKSYEKALRTAEKKARDFADNFKEIGLVASGVSVALGAVGVAALKVAGDFREVQSAAEVVFGGKAAAADVEAWAARVGEAMGRSRVQMLDFVTRAQMLIDPMVGNKEAAAEMSKTVAQLAVDIASMNNVADTEALVALRSAISGETEPMKRFGVVMSETNLEAFALSKGLSGNVKDMTEAGKTALRLQFILEKTANAHGDAARNADSFSNQLKRAQGGFQDMANTIGQSLVPVATRMLQVINQAIAWFNALDQSTVRWIAGIGAAVAAVSALTAAFVGVATALPFVIAGFKTMATVVIPILAPILLKILAIAAAVGAAIAVVAALRIAWKKNLLGIREISLKVWNAVIGHFQGVWEGFKAVIKFIWNAWRNTMLSMVRGAQKVLRWLGVNWSLPHDVLDLAEFALSDEGIKTLVDTAQDVGKEVGEALFFGLKEIGSEIRSWLPDIFKDVSAKIPSVGLDGVPDFLRIAREGDAPPKMGAIAPVMRFDEGSTIEAEAPTLGGFALDTLAEAVKSGVRGLGATIEAAMQGAAIGGHSGAVVGALLGALTQSEQFLHLLDMVGGIVGTVGELLNALVPAIQPLIGALKMLLSSGFAALAPLFNFVAVVTEPIAAVLVSLSAVFAGLAPIIQMLSGVLTVAATLLVAQLIPVFGILFEAFKWLGIGLLELAKGIGPLWNGVIDAFNEALRAIAGIQINILGVVHRPFAFLEGFADALDKSKVPLQDLQEQQDRLRAMTFDSAVEQARLAAATNEAADAMHTATDAMYAATEALTNVPSGYKVALARFNATQPAGSASVPIGSAAGNTLVVENLTIKTDDPEKIWNIVKAMARRDGYREYSGPLVVRA